ncbi:hypothetical protein DPMN_015764 [Dreissena polymorpha]|uniref:Uncharacterized protein n=1 Tax=Dreissena polymorpha TaxID=45954 RepID=A0A9D4S3X8_DREPO|nr:hypothetical protein DPMN_015764 [Dreissena polymorpha]
MRKEGCAQGQHPSHIKNQHATETNTKENNNSGPRMEARQETVPRTANHPIADIFGPKSSRRVGCWNVRTLPDRKASPSGERDGELWNQLVRSK